MKTGDVAKLFGVSNTTINQWQRRFAGYLSEKKGRQRIYDQNDVLVLATVARLSADGHSLAEINNQLEDGYRVEDVGAANFGIDHRMIPAAAVEQIIDAAELRTELEQVKAERDKLAVFFQNAQETAAKWEEKHNESSAKITELQDKIATLERQLGRAEVKAEQLDELKEQMERERQKKRWWFGRD